MPEVRQEKKRDILIIIMIHMLGLKQGLLIPVTFKVDIINY